jgi:hypothetical protein
MLLFDERRRICSTPIPQNRMARETQVQTTTYAFLRQNHTIINTRLKHREIALKADNIRLEDDLIYQNYHDLQQAYTTRHGASDHASLGNLGYWHGFRILLTFARLTDDLTARVFHDAHGFDFLQRTLGRLFTFNFEQSLAIFDLPVQIFYALSVAILGLRFLIMVLRALKHAFYPTNAELEASQRGDTTPFQRFCHEIYTYRIRLANDAVWASLNGLSNYPEFFHISMALANGLILACVLFDLGLLAYGYFGITSVTYKSEQALYEEEKNRANDPKEIARIHRQIIELDLDYARDTAIYCASTTASLTLLVGFSLLVTASIPIMAPIGSFLCIAGSALYLSVDTVGDYWKNQKALEIYKKHDIDIRDANDNAQKYWREGFSTFTKNTFLPVVFIGVTGVCWPAGLLLLAGYAAYNCSTCEEQHVPRLLN